MRRFRINFKKVLPIAGVFIVLQLFLLVSLLSPPHNTESDKNAYAFLRYIGQQLNSTYKETRDHKYITAWRLQKLKERCDLVFPNRTQPSVPSPPGLPGKVLVSDRFQIAIYTVYKAGCSSWFYALANNSKTASSPPLDEAPFISNLWKKSIINKFDIKFMEQYKGHRVPETYYRVLTTRHPLARLESAYSEKMKPLVYCKRHEKTIVDKYRVKCGTTKEEVKSIEQCVTFAEFLEFILDMPAKTYNVWLDMHWWPYTKNKEDTKICDQKFDYLSRTETQNSDMEYMIHHHLAGIGHPTHSNPAVSRDSRKILPVFSRMRDPQGYIDRLMVHYQRDMDLFGYTYSIQNGTVFAMCKTYFGNVCI